MNQNDIRKRIAAMTEQQKAAFTDMIFADTEKIVNAAPQMLAESLLYKRPTLNMSNTPGTDPDWVRELKRRIAVAKQQREERETLKLSKILDKETLFRFAYVPFVIAQLVWDYAETITDMAAMLRISETRKLCRAVKELRRDYDRIRAPHIDAAHEESEVSNMYVFEDCVADITKQLLLNLRINLRSEYPEIEEDYLSYLIAVYQCDITLKSLLLYTRRQTEIIARKIDRNVGHILPESVYKLNHLVLEFVGDKPVSDKFATLKKQYIETFATQIALAELTELPDDNE